MPESTPAPAPNATPAPAPAAAPSTPAQSESFFDAIDALEAKPAPKKEAAPPAPEKKPDVEKVVPEDKIVSEKPVEQPAKAEEQKPFRAAELRTAYETLKKEHKALKEEHEKIKTAKPPEDPEKPKLIESLQSKDKRIQELEEKLRYASYESTDEYKEKYEKPLTNIYNAGRSKAASLKVVKEGEERPGARTDFDAIMRISDDAEAADKATELFGNKASLVLYYRERVLELNDQKMQAIEDFKKQGAERTKSETEKATIQKAESEKAAKARSEMFHKLTAESLSKNKLIQLEETDEVGKNLLTAAKAVADLAFNSLPPERFNELPPNVRSKLVNGKLRPEDVVRLHAELHTRAAAYSPLAHKFTKAEARIAELEKELSEFKGSGPGGGAEKRPQGSKALTVEEEIDAMDKKR